MDWDDQKYNREEFAEHLNALGIQSDPIYINELLARTTTNSEVDKFSFKPRRLAIGSAVDGQFYVGFEAKVESAGVNIHSKIKDPDDMKSSFWFHFDDPQHWQCFQMRAFCSGHEGLAFSPYECCIPFRDVVPGGIKLRTEYRKDCKVPVTVQLSIKTRRSPRYSRRLQCVINPGLQPIYDRYATEADFFGQKTAELDAGIIQGIEDHRLVVNVGLWNTHRVSFGMSVKQYKLLWMLMVRFRVLGLHPDFNDAARLEPNPMPMPRWSPQLLNLQPMPFPVRFLIEALLSHGNIALPELDDLLPELSRIPPSRQHPILEGLFTWNRRSTITVDMREVARRVSPPRDLDAHLVLIRRCLVTPTKCILMPPVPETSNAMLRRFKEHEDRFLRVQFVDEDSDFPATRETLVVDDKLQGAEGVFARVRRALRSGIFIADRHYVFATFSESQVRERGCWMISETEGFTVQNILRWMGDLENERIVAKHAARQGLALSSTRAVHIPIRFTRGYPDIKRNGFTFTDGAGQCTQQVASECARVVGYSLTPVSAVQFRDGGVKGILSVVNDSSLEEFEIRERDSMIKIQSENREFCVLKVATYSKATLNRQSILLMEAQGVPTQTLLDIFQAEKLAIEGLECGLSPERLATVSTFPLVQSFGHKITGDPFVENIVNLVKCRMLRMLKWKAWVEIPESAVLMGVPDETGSLGEGEVFCQIHPPHGGPQIITRQCLIYRNPCLHPGDVRIVRAVDAPALRHLRNVIVFSVRGQRDLPNMLSGGDLDGDMYSLIWDPRLIIPNIHEPMDYTGPTANKCDRPITIEQTKEHFMNFIKNDVLGRICNAHLALADQFGPQDRECIDLAGLASKAVDFGKTGVPVSWNELPNTISKYPDFMGKEYHVKPVRTRIQPRPIESYPSEKALGRIFRAIDPEPEFYKLDETEWATHGDPRLLACEDPVNYRDYLEEAVKQKIRYEFELEGLLRRYNISEAECVAGLLLRSPKTRVRVEKDYDIRVAVRDAYARVVAGAKDRVDGYLDRHPSGPSKDVNVRAWALAAYKITYDYSDRFAIYREVKWSAEDFDYMDEEEEDGFVKTFKAVLTTNFNVPTSLKRRYSFAWLFSSQIFHLLEELHN